MHALQTKRWHEFDSQPDFEQAACRFILENAARAITARGAFHIVLAGGNTPRNIYQQLCTAHTDWSAWHIYFGDERCLAPDNPERNSCMARSVWLDHVAIPSAHIHEIPAELGPEVAAEKYARAIAQVGNFDLALLGLGEDGHTASLFPGGAWEQSATLADAIPVRDAPKPPPQRVSLSSARLSRSECVIFLVTVKGKLDAVNRWRAGIDLPASRIMPAAGVDVFLNLGDDNKI